jgi:acetyl-CoA carboxylase carboxyltransferase component
VENDKTDSATAVTTTTTAAEPTADWFGDNKAAVCPALTQWYGAIGQAAYIAANRGPWPETRIALLEQASAVSAAFEKLLPAANAAGKPEVEYLIANDERLTATLQTSASAAAYATGQRTLVSERLTKNVAILLQAEKSCPKS